MVDGRDVVHLYGDHYAVRDVANAWIAAGSPPINSSWRSYQDQKDAWIRYQNGTGSPADNPDDPDNYALGHTRAAALDIDATPERVARLEAAGLIRPFPYESWHWAPKNVYYYPIVRTLPASAGDGSTPFNPTPIVDTALLRRQKEDTMYISNNQIPSVVYAVYTDRDGKEAMRVAGPAEAAFAIQGGLVVSANPGPITNIAAEAGYAKPKPSTQDAVWGTKIERYRRDASGAIVMENGQPVIDKIDALQELANIRSEQIADNAPKA